MLKRRDFLKHLVVGTATYSTLPSILNAAPSSDSSAENTWPESKFLSGNYAPVTVEMDSFDLKVIGELPADLEGLYVRNGPNPSHAPMRTYHWFDGDGMIHGVKLGGGKASYHNRWVDTQCLAVEKAAGESLWPGINDPLRISKAPKDAPRFKNTANTALTYHNGKLLALWEAGVPHALNPTDLSTVGPYDFEQQLTHNFAAHPKIDPETGELITFGYQVLKAPYLSHSVFDSQGQLISSTAIDLPRPVMVHDCAITKNYTLILDLPEVFQLKRVFIGQSPMKFLPKFGARIGLLPRYAKSDQTRWFNIKPCFVFHTLGAWEEADEVVLVASRYQEFPDVINTGSSKESSAEPNLAQSAFLYEWRFNLKTGHVSERALEDIVTEFPRINPQYIGKKPRYGYTLSGDLDKLYKVDLKTGGRIEHNMAGLGGQGGEAMFVPRPGGTAEDDGYLINLRHNTQTNKGELHVVHAQDMEGESLARVLLPTRVPYGFHGEWVPGSAFTAG